MRIRRVVAVSVSFLATVSFVVSASVISAGSASAAPNDKLCVYNPVRGPVSEFFVLDACVDGTSIVLQNNHSFPVTISRSPADPGTGANLQGVGTLQPISLSENSYDKVTRTAYHASGAKEDLLLPDDTVRYPIGPSGGEVDVSQVSPYILATYAAVAFITSLNAKLGTADAVRAWADRLLEGRREYNICVATRHKSKLGCLKFATGVILKQAASLLFGLTRRGVIGLLAKFIQTITAQQFAFSDSTGYLTQGPLHLRLSPASASIASGGSQAYTVEGSDAANDDLGPVTDATLAISPDGSCTGYTCTATTAGPHTITATDGSATGTATLTVGTTYPISFTASVNLPMGGGGFSELLNSGAEVTVTGVQQGDCNGPSYTQSVCNYVFTGVTGTLYGNEGSGNTAPCSVSAQVAVGQSGGFRGGVTLGESPDGNAGIVIYLLAVAAQTGECDAGIYVGSPYDSLDNPILNLSSPWVPGSQASSWTVSFDGNTSDPVVGSITMNWQY